MVAKKTRYFEMDASEQGFVSRLKGTDKSQDFSDLKILRNLLTDEKARILHTLKSKSPESIYQLAKELKKDLKSLRTDIKILERFGFIEIVSHKKGNRTLHKPVLAVEKMEFILRI